MKQAAMLEERRTDRAYAGIVEIINAEALEVGDRLPSESRLAEMFGTSRTVVREALVRLASDGITEARRGAGSFVKRRPSVRLGSHMPMDELSATLGTFEVRFVLETEAARLAAIRRSPQQMETIRAAMADLRHALVWGDSAHAEDMALHQAISSATTNPMFLLTFNQMQTSVERIMRAGVDISRSRSVETVRTMLDEHEMIVEAIDLQDPDGAALAMRWHLSQGRKRLMP